jgi:glycosyltransferase involved in cell wall biosynthesis
VRNGGAYLEAALQSIVEQTHDNLEIVISDNASTDLTAAICAHFAREDSRIRYFRQPEPVPADVNFRFAFEQCSSDWFMWASHDDLRDSTYVATLLDGFEADPSASLVFGDAVVFSDRAAPSSGTQLPVFPSRALDLEDRHLTLVRNSALQIYGLFRSDVLKTFRWPTLPGGYDWLILHWAATFGDCVHAPGSTFYYYVPADEESRRARHSYYWLRSSWLDDIRYLPDVRWAVQASRELVYARRALGIPARRRDLFPALCFMHHGGAANWARSFVYWNAPSELRMAWRSLKRAVGAA